MEALSCGPVNLDILAHLPERDLVGYDKATACVAHSIQYGLCASGNTVEEAVGRLVDLIAVHLERAKEMQIKTIMLADQSIQRAFFLGIPLECDRIGVSARKSQNLHVRDICALQRKSGERDVAKWVEKVAA